MSFGPQIQTTVYISCGKCQKQILQQQGSLCASCNASALTCSIWLVLSLSGVSSTSSDDLCFSRLPVRTMAFHCPVCSHGGHLHCYRRYYVDQPLTELLTHPSSLSNDIEAISGQDRGRSVSRNSTATTIVDEGNAYLDVKADRPPSPALSRLVLGHMCASGCGHYCWVSNETEQILEE